MSVNRDRAFPISIVAPNLLQFAGEKSIEPENRNLEKNFRHDGLNSNYCYNIIVQTIITTYR